MQVAQKSSESSQSFRIGIVGIDNKVLQSMSRIFAVTQYRTRRYQASVIPTASTDTPDQYDILMINMHNPLALGWYRNLQSVGYHFKKPLIKIIKASVKPKSIENVITFPFNPGKTLQTLDKYTVQNLNFLPELTIGCEKQPCDKTQSHIQLLETKTPEKTSQFNALVVDDSLAVRRQLTLEFRLLGIEANVVESGERALEMCKSQNFDIVFLDVVMPGINGYNTCKAIKRTADNKKTPVILLTSKSGSIDKLKGSLSGCDTYLTKPINHNEFCNVVGQYLDIDAE